MKIGKSKKYNLILLSYINKFRIKFIIYYDYYFYQDGIIMDGINKFNTNFYIENHEQIELNKKQTEDIIKNAQKLLINYLSHFKL